jgi:hypothetical protein
MAYVSELGTGQRIYAENRGTQTAITLSSSQAGQQQQASYGFETGAWSGPPELFQTATGFVLKLATDRGNYFIQIQGSNVSMAAGLPAANLQPLSMQQATSPLPSSLPPMPPMQPMQPMTLGNMQMSMNPMEMRMGNMEMRMEPSAPTSSQGTRRFCSQCGAAIKPEDKFCSSCGHRQDS